MASADEPIVGRDFRVVLTVRGPRGGLHDEVELPFSEVVMPSLRLDGRGRVDDRDEPVPSSNPNLVLRRGHTGSSELFDLWKAARDRERHQLRDVVVMVLGTKRLPVVGWRFSGCHVVALDHSRLDALDGAVLTESLEVAFETVEQIEI